MTIVKFTNAQLAWKDGTFRQGDLLVDSESGLILSPQQHFYSHKHVDRTIDLRDSILSPGFIDAQINGAYSVDFSLVGEDEEEYIAGLDTVSKRIVETGTTAYVPTVITQQKAMYQRLLPLLRPRTISDGAHVLGYHAEGPFLFPEKKGAHEPSFLLEAKNGMRTWEEVYGRQALDQDGVKIITAAPDVEGVIDCIAPATKRGVTCSVGHSNAPVDLASRAISLGARWVTHLFNAMPQMHHRDPGVIGTLGAQAESARPFWGIIADGIHVHPNAVRLAYDCHPQGAVLVTDAMPLMDPKLPDGAHKWRDGRCIHKEGLKLTIEGTETLAGAAISLDACVRNLAKFTSAPLSQAIRAATYNVSEMLGGKVAARKGSLEVGKHADLVILDKHGHVRSTWIMGREVWTADEGVELQVEAEARSCKL
ncbi:N-acetyl-glucosamine-6-phosphate deacetylase [Microbotryomycetes sp. JL221]|nr:N-acetyl-glucosamine-6-phosphate deacetylase [Microbotryomycetes sp. JL221]